MILMVTVVLLAIVNDFGGHVEAVKWCNRYRCDGGGCGCRWFQSEWCGVADQCGSSWIFPMEIEGYESLRFACNRTAGTGSNFLLSDIYAEFRKKKIKKNLRLLFNSILLIPLSRAIFLVFVLFLTMCILLGLFVIEHSNKYSTYFLQSLLTFLLISRKF